MFPLFWWNYSIICKIHSNCPSIIICNTRIMIIFLIWYFLLIVSLMHSFCKIISFFSFWWIFILFILPIFWYNNAIIPKIVTNCVSFNVSQFRIMLHIFTWDNTINSLYHSISLTLFIAISPFFRYFYIIFM